MALIEQQPSLACAQTDNGTSLLALAAEAGANALIAALLRAGAPVNPQGAGATPLSRAAARCDLPALQRLLQAGADPNASGDSSEHALIVAARAGSLACVEALIGAGAGLKAAEKRRALEQVRGPEFRRIGELLAGIKAPARAKRQA